MGFFHLAFQSAAMLALFVSAGQASDSPDAPFSGAVSVMKAQSLLLFLVSKAFLPSGGKPGAIYNATPSALPIPH